MGTLGPNDLKQLAIPANWDAGMLSRLALATGETYEQLLTDIASALAIANGTLTTNPVVASLVSTTTDATLEYRTGVSNGFEVHTEYAQPDAQRAGVTGGMLPMTAWDRKFGWTWDFLRKARRSQLDADIGSGMADLQNLWEKAVLTRLFKSTYDAVGTGRSVPIADAGVADASYVPINMPNRAAAFASSHTHLLRLNGITQANIETAVLTLWEHGYDAPYDMIIAQADVGAWETVANVTGFVKKANGLIRYGVTTAIAEVDNDFIGVIETAYGSVRVRASARVPTAYWAVYKSFGSMDSRNPLVMRESPQFGSGAVLLSGRQYNIQQFPLEGAILFSEFGVGVADRTAAAIVYNYTSGNYVIPTIS